MVQDHVDVSARVKSMLIPESLTHRSHRWIKVLFFLRALRERIRYVYVSPVGIRGQISTHPGFLPIVKCHKAGALSVNRLYYVVSDTIGP